MTRKGSMKHTFVLFVALVWQGNAFDHDYAQYAQLLRTYVCDGGVAYGPMKGDTLVDRIKDRFSSVESAEYESFSEPRKLAYLINLYNFYTIVLILENYPLETGIRDIGSPWKLTFVPFKGKEVSLDHIEHKLIRTRFDEPRIHFALVCAAGGCPALADEPFTADALDRQLTAAGKKFLKSPSKNRIEDGEMKLSKIFKWYGKDFKGVYDGYENYIIDLLGLEGKWTVSFMEYDWRLNEVRECVGDNAGE